MVEALLTLREAADELRVSVPTLRRWRQRGLVRMVRLPGGTLRVSRTEVERLQSEAIT